MKSDETLLPDGVFPAQESSDFEAFIAAFDNFFATEHNGEQKTTELVVNGKRIVLGDYRTVNYKCTIDVRQNNKLIFTSHALTPEQLLQNFKERLLMIKSSSLPRSS